MAIVAVLPFAWILWVDLHSPDLTLPRIAILFQLSLFVVTMVVRSAPVRITSSPLYWLVAFVASYYGFLTSSFLSEGQSLVPTQVTGALSLVSVAIDVYARLSLGRNIGFVPAQRRLVTGGAYRWVRHPIYSALFLAEVSVILESYSAVNLGFSAVFFALFVVKTLMEERFLGEDPEYAAYLRRVRYRWIPGIL